MGVKPIGLDHVNIFVRNAERSHRWYTDILGLHTQDTMMSAQTGRTRAVFLAADPDHGHDIALFDVGDEAPLQQKGQVGLNHFAWRMASLDDLKTMYHRLEERGVPFSVSDHTISLGIYFSDPDGNGLEVYYELPRSEWHRDHPFSNSRPEEKGRFPGPWDAMLGQAAPVAARA
jgi:catechol 2,3-dioxygenase